MITSKDVYNNLILSYVIFSFNKLNLFPEFRLGALPENVAKDKKLDLDRFFELIKVSEVMGILKSQGKKKYLTELGLDLEENRGFFTWAIGGYSPLLESMDLFTKSPETQWLPYVRGNYVAVGSDEANQELMQPIFDKVIDSIDCSCVADLGCGNAGKLVKLLNRNKKLTGVGIDINPQAIEVAQKNIDTNGLSQRVDLLCENVFESLTKPEPVLEKVDLVMSFMMLHDLFNIKELEGDLFNRMKIAFPNAKYFLLADTCLDDNIRNYNTMPMFTMGYELIHKMRGIKNFNIDYYRKRFKSENIELVGQYDFGVPNTYLFVLKI